MDGFRHTLLLSALALLCACGGGGGGGSSTPAPTWQAGQFADAGQFANQCLRPRTGSQYPDVAGSVLDENNWLRSWSHETYLWYDEIQDRNPANHDESLAYFDLLKTEAITASGAPKDQFHFAMPSGEWNAQSQSGVAVGYGLQWVIIESLPPRDVRVAYHDQQDRSDLPPRGTRLLSVDGVSMVSSNDIDTLNAGLYPGENGEQHRLEFEYPGGTRQTLTLSAGTVTSEPVQRVRVLTSTGGTQVGYMLFNDHIATAEGALRDAVAQLSQGNGIDDLVLDLRYNGGGYLALASQLAYMIAGPERTAGQSFEIARFNDQHPTTNPVTGQPLAPTPFYNTTLGFSVPANEPLPNLNLSRVFVLTGATTCSASESIINGLRGIGVEVIQIGNRTCGKPYGFYPTDNCGTTYFTIQFQGVNAQGFGDYPDGFVPGTDDGQAGVRGCQVADDYDHDLGDVDEARLSSALHYIDNGYCPPSTSRHTLHRRSLAAPPAVDGRVHKAPWRENRIMTPTR
ncbi:S41 family peptidase [Alcanivorax sp. 24]|uniref:S41 family peptidase n=1 Tax=Alcanivorax sp. 24 TaxID=2545266 RepID=UPI00105F3669|nr:S41 family peptidase [Alcanivorax sp. 24]